MSHAKGFEVKFRDCCIRMSERQMNLMDVVIRKESDLFILSVGGIMSDKETHCSLCCVYDLGEGDEITIERKDIEQSSPPIFCASCEEAFVAFNQHRLALLHDLEAYLTGKGLVKK
jgi:hypothetical protein